MEFAIPSRRLGKTARANDSFQTEGVFYARIHLVYCCGLDGASADRQFDLEPDRDFVALVEILVGVIAGNLAVGLEGGTLHVGIAGAGTNAGQLHHVLQSTEWINSWHCSAVACSRFSLERKSIPFR